MEALIAKRALPSRFGEPPLLRATLLLVRNANLRPTFGVAKRTPAGHGRRSWRLVASPRRVTTEAGHPADAATGPDSFGGLALADTSAAARRDAGRSALLPIQSGVMTRKHALITGITGQDGAYLAKFLLENDYEVYGLRRQTSLPNEDRLAYLGVADHVQLIDGDILDQSSIITALRAAEPHEIYNLAS